MGLLDLIERVREQPVAERKRLALSVAIGITLFIGLVWLSFMAMRLSDKPQDINETQDGLTVASATPFETISQSIEDAWGGVDKAIKAFGSVEYIPKEVKNASSTAL